MKHEFHAIILGLSPTGLYVARELGKAGGQLLGVDHGPAVAQASRYFGGRTWRIRGTEGLLARLVEYGAMTGSRPLLVPTSDIFIEWMMDNASALRTAFEFPAGYDGVALDLLDKVRFHALCANHGVATPGIWQAGGRSELSVLGEKVPFPCILKPVLIHRAKAFLKGHKVFVARSREEFSDFVARIPDDSGAWFVQEIVPGPESSITLFAAYLDRAGKVREGLTARKLRQYPSGFGSASLVISEACPETREISTRFLEAIGYRGVCGVEFKRDPRDGLLKIIEINPRPTLWFHLTHAAGKRIVEAAARDLLGLPPRVERPQLDGVLWRYALKDMASRLFYATKGKDFIFPPPAVGAARLAVRHCSPVFEASDPLPALMEPFGFLRKAISRL